jgi:predicted amidohydrolase
MEPPQQAEEVTCLDESTSGRSRSVRIALVQMLVQNENPGANLERALAHISEAAAQGAQVVVLPEALPRGWTHPSEAAEAEEIPNGNICARLRAAAREHRVYVCSGLIERAAGRIFNSAVLLSPAGDVILHHRKINELSIAHPSYSLGDRLGVACTPLGRIGLMICADAFARDQVLSRALGYMGADIILSPCAWAMPAEHDNAKEPYGQLWLDNYCPVARDFRLWIVGVSNVGWIADGPWRGRKCIGSSLVIGPAGEMVCRGPYGVDAEALLYAEVTTQPRPAQGEGWAAYWQTA